MKDYKKTALLQARHAYNEAKLKQVIDGGGFTMGSNTVVIHMNHLAWGYFEQAILNAFKHDEELSKDHLVSDDKTCPECKGAGNFPYVGEEYDRQLAEWNEGHTPDDRFYCKPGTPLAKFCSPCQGTGIVLKRME